MNFGWKYEEESDQLPGHDEELISSRISSVIAKPFGGVYLKRNEGERLAIEWNPEYSVITHSQDGCRFECAATLDSLEACEDLSRDFTLDWVCGCCGVSLGCFSPENHISKSAGFEVFQYFLEKDCRPKTCSQGELIWSNINV